MLVDRSLCIKTTQREIVRRNFRLKAEAGEAPISGTFFGAVDLHTRCVADRGPEVGLPGGKPRTGPDRPGERKIAGNSQRIDMVSTVRAFPANAELRDPLGADLHHDVASLDEPLRGCLQIRIDRHRLRFEPV